MRFKGILRMGCVWCPIRINGVVSISVGRSEWATFAALPRLVCSGLPGRPGEERYRSRCLPGARVARP